MPYASGYSYELQRAPEWLADYTPPIALYSEHTVSYTLFVDLDLSTDLHLITADP